MLVAPLPVPTPSGTAVVTAPAPSPSPVEPLLRVVVDNGDPSWFSTWGPLVGVIVGATLAGLLTLFAGSLQDNRRKEQADRELRRVTYAEFMSAVGDELRAWSELHSAQAANRLKEKIIESYIDAHHHRVRKGIEIALIAPLGVQAAVDRLGTSLEKLPRNPVPGKKGRDHLTWMARLQYDVAVEMRKDLKVPGTVRLDPEMEAKGAVPDDYPSGWNAKPPSRSDGSGK